MKNPVFYLMLTIVIAFTAMIYSLSNQHKGRIEIVGYKAILNDTLLLDSIIQDTTSFKMVFPNAKMTFIPVTKTKN